METNAPFEAAPPICTLCRVEPARGRSHILPQALHKDLMEDGNDVMHVITGDPQERISRSRTGPWDDSILCAGCEAKSGKYDQSVVEALRTQPVTPSLWIDANTVEIPGAHADRMKLGLMHIVWRTHATSRMDFHLEALDAERLRTFLQDDDPGGPEDFGVILAVHDPDPEFEGIWAAPVPREWAPGWHGVHICYSRWEIMMTCSRGGIPANVKQALLTTGQPVLATATHIKLRDTVMFKEALEVARRRIAAGTWGDDSS